MNTNGNIKGHEDIKTGNPVNLIPQNNINMLQQNGFINNNTNNANPAIFNQANIKNNPSQILNTNINPNPNFPQSTNGMHLANASVSNVPPLPNIVPQTLNQLMPAFSRAPQLPTTMNNAHPNLQNNQINNLPKNMNGLNDLVNSINQQTNEMIVPPNIPVPSPIQNSFDHQPSPILPNLISNSNLNSNAQDNIIKNLSPKKRAK